MEKRLRQKRRSADFSFSIFGVWERHLKPRGDYLYLELVSTSSKMLGLVNSRIHLIVKAI